MVSKVETGLSELIGFVGQCKKRNQSVVLCHGVFDLLHIGHIKYLQEAKTLADVLVVTVTADPFVNKGPGRPVFPDAIRAEALRALNVVDYVAISHEPTAIAMLQQVKPNKYVKGPDYKNAKNDITGNLLLEKQAIESVGGEMVFTSGEIFSSSKVLNQHMSPLTSQQRQYVSQLKSKYSFDDIVSLLDRLNSIKPLFFGETIIDEYIFCETIGKSGKEPVLTNRKLFTERYAGGVIAAVNHAAAFCDEVRVLTYLGEKESNEEFIKAQLASNVTLDYVEKKDSPTILKTRLIDNYTKTKIAALYDINDQPLGECLKPLLIKLGKSLEQSDVTVVLDYSHGLISQPVSDYLQFNAVNLSINKQLNSFNLHTYAIDQYRKCELMCIQESELRFDMRNHITDIKALSYELYKRLSLRTLVITCGKNGSVCWQDDVFSACPAFATKVVDRVGAGDTLMAITSICFAANLPVDLVLLLGNLAGAAMVSSMGTGMKLNKVNLLRSIEVLLK